MRLRSAPAICVLAVLASLGLCDAGRADDVSPQKALPKWRLRASAFSDGGNALGVYRRVGQRWDLGVQAAVSLHDREGDAERKYDGVSDRDSRRYLEDDSREGVSIDLDLRRWSAARDRVRWFMGPRVGVGVDHWISSYETVEEPPGDRQRREYESDEFRIHTHLVLGGDLELLSRLSVAFALRPFRFNYSWIDRTEKEIYEAVIEGDSYSTREDGEDNGWTITTRLDPSIYLTLGID